MMYGDGKSDSSEVPAKLPNKGEWPTRRSYGGSYTGTKVETPDTAKGTPTAPSAGARESAEEVEGRELAKGNPRQQPTPRTQRRPGVHSALERIRQAARRDGTILSSSAVTPSGLCRPSALGMYTLRTGFAR